MIEFDGGYGRQGRIELGTTLCVACHKEALCLIADSSEGEYEVAAICKPCIDAQFTSAGSGK